MFPKRRIGRLASVISPKYEGSKDTCYRGHDGIKSAVQAQPGLHLFQLRWSRTRGLVLGIRCTNLV